MYICAESIVTIAMGAREVLGIHVVDKKSLSILSGRRFGRKFYFENYLPNSVFVIVG